MGNTESGDKKEAVGAVRRYASKRVRAGHLAGWERSGLSARGYSALQGLGESTLYRWRAQERGQQRPPAKDSAAKAQEAGRRFMTIDMEGCSVAGASAVPSAGSGVRVLLRRGALEVEIRGVDVSGDLAELAKLLRREVLDA